MSYLKGNSQEILGENKMLEIIVQKQHIDEETGEIVKRKRFAPKVEAYFLKLADTFHKDKELFYFLQRYATGITPISFVGYRLLENAAGGSLPKISQITEAKKAMPKTTGERLSEEYLNINIQSKKRFEEKIKSELKRIREKNPVYFSVTSAITKFAGSKTVREQCFQDIVLVHNLVESEVRRIQEIYNN